MTDRRNTQFLKSVREQELLGPAQVTELEQCPLAQSDDLQALGKLILQKGWLTRFQINLIAQARAKDLILGPYRLIDRLGEGGMGQVFKAHHQPMNRSVALKVIRKEKLAHPQAVQRFFREIQAAAKLVHPNIVLAFDAGQVEKTYYFAMEYVDGIDLAKLVKQNGPLPEKVACDYIRQAALGLTHAHEQGMIHRDIKPHNLLVTHVSDTSSSRASVSSASKAGVRDVVKILDMGLARLQTGGPSDHSITQEGAVVGTPDYIAPEQALDARKVDGRSDLYSLGGVFFFLLTGRPPFQGGTLAELLLKHQMEAAPDVRQLRPEISEGVAAIVTHLLAKRPEDRYQTPQDLVQALEPLIQGGSNPLAWSRAAEPNAFSGLGDGSVDSPSSATVAQPGRPKAAATRRSPRSIGLLAGSGAALVALIAGAVLLATSSGSRKDSQRALAEATAPRPTDPIGPVAEGPFQLQLPAAAIVTAGQATTVEVRVDRQGNRQPIDLAGLNVPRGVTVLAVQLGPNEDRAQVRLLAAVDAPEIQGMPLTIQGRAGARMVQGDVRLTVQRPAAVVVRPPDLPPAGDVGKELWKIDTGKSVPYCLAVSPDSRRGLIGRIGQALVVDLATGKEIRKLDKPGQGVVFGVAFLPDGRQFLTLTSNDRALRLWDVETGQLVREVAVFSFTARGFALTPNGRRIFVWGNPQKEIYAHDLETGKELFQMEGHTNAVLTGMVSADGRRVLSASPGDVIWWDAETGKQLGRVEGTVFTAALSPDGRRALLSLGKRAPLMDLDKQQETLQLQENQSSFRSLAWLPDGRQAIAGFDEPGCALRLYDTTSGQLLARFDGHQQKVQVVAASPDGRYALSASSDSTVRCWDLKPPVAAAVRPPAQNEDGVLGRFEGHEVYWVAVSPDGRQAVSSSMNGSLILWDTQTFQEIRRFVGHKGNVYAVEFSPDGRHILSGSLDRTARLWEVATGRERYRLEGHDDWVFSVAFSPDGRRGLTAGRDKTIRLWDLEAGQMLNTFKGHEGLIRQVSFCPDGKRFISGGDDRTVRLWNAETGEALGVIRNFAGSIYALAMTPNGRLVLSAAAPASLWDLTSGKDVHLLNPRHGGQNFIAAISSDGRMALTAAGPYLIFWDVQTGRELARVDIKLTGTGNAVFFPDGKKVLVSCSKAALVVDLSRIAGVGVVQPPDHSPPVQKVATPDAAKQAEVMVPLPGHTDKVTSVVISPDGKQALSGSADKTLKLWDLESAKELATLTGHTGELQLVSWSPDGRRALSSSADGNVRYWDLEQRRSLKSHNWTTPPRSFSLDLKDPAFFYTTQDGRVGRSVIETNTGTVIAVPGIYRLVLASPDGTRFLIGCDDGSLRVWETAPAKGVGQQVANLPGHTGPISAVAVSGDGKRAATGGADSTVRLYDLTGFRYERVLKGHLDKVTAVSMSSDGRLVLSGSEDKTLRLWDAQSGKEVRRFPFHPDGITGAALSPDGRFVISACGDKVLRLWDLKAAKPY